MKKIINIILFTCIIGQINGQLKESLSAPLSDLTSFPAENIHISFNSSVLLSGEYLYYKVYCLNTDKRKLSSLSKLAYIELVGSDLKSVFKQKIALKNGVGQADFFIPVSVPSGNYKLIGYTNWMRNNTKSPIYQSDLLIINPYRTNPTMIRLNDSSLVEDRNVLHASAVINPVKKEVLAPNRLNISNLADHYKTRSKVDLNLEILGDSSSAQGNFTLSVRKIDDIPQPAKAAIEHFWTKPFDVKIDRSMGSKKALSLPDLRGELIQGKVRNFKNDLTLNNLKISLSIPGTKPYFAIAQTNLNGVFYFNITNDYDGDQAVLALLTKDKDGYQVTLDSPTAMDYSQLKFKDHTVTTAMRNAILERSVHNQVENAYFQFKPDSILQQKPKSSDKTYLKTAYKLDDYNRFPTLKETIIEIIKDVSIQKTDGNDPQILIQGYDFDTKTGILPLILIDGVRIDNHDELLNFNALNIDEISVWRDQFIIGSVSFQGMIHIKTIKGFQANPNDPNLLILPLVKSEPNKRYYRQHHDLDSPDFLPDDRIQLLWVPSINLNKEQLVSFYTSDVKGDFEIIIEGFTKEGAPLLFRKMIRVK